MSISKLRVCTGVLVMLCLLVGLFSPAVSPNDQALAETTLPDLIIESISCSPETPVIGDTLTFTVTIRNQAESQANSSLIAYFIDDVYLETDYVKQVAANTTVINTYTWQAQAGEHMITAIIDYDDRITESNEDNNEKTYAFSVLAADLAVDEVTWTPEQPAIGDTVTFKLTITNRGNYRVPAVYVNLFIDGNPRVRQLTPPMLAGDSVNMTYIWTALSGPHAVEAVADVLNQIDESDETNNHKMVYYATPTPDLVIQSVTWSPSTRTGSSEITFTVKVKNQGNGTATSSLLAYYIDGVYEDADQVVQLSPGATTTETFKKVLDGHAHTFKTITDPLDTITEVDETNNTTEATLPAIAPDLIIQSITWSPSTPLKAHNVIFTITVKNQGTMQADCATLDYYIDEKDRLYSLLAPIPAGSTETVSFSWVTRSSSITLRAIVDPENYVVESNESNNEMTKTVSFTTPAPSADLIINSITSSPANPSVGDTVTITATIKNNGTGIASPSHINYYIGGNLLNTVYVSLIEAGATLTSKTTWSAVPGTHTVRAVVDCNDGISETSESNNSYTATISVPAPDLTFQDITWSPLVPSVGNDMTVTLTIKNNGDLKSGNSFVSYYVNGIYQGNHNFEGIEPGLTITRSFTWKAESEVLTFKAIIDKASSIIEIDETNNEKTVVIPAPDLVIESVTWSPLEPAENDTVTFVITAGNLGGSTADSPQLSCYIDDAVQTRLVISSVTPGSSAAGTFTWTARSGEHIFKVIADVNDSITESDETNNTKVIDLSNPAGATEAPPEPVVEAAEPAASTQISEPAGSETIVIEEIEDIEIPPADNMTDNTTDAEDIAAGLGEEDSSGVLGILMNKFVMFGVAGVGVAAIVILMLLRRRAKTKE